MGGRCRDARRENGGQRPLQHRQHHSRRPRFGIGRKKGTHRHALGRSRGGFTSKLHCLADALGRPLAFHLKVGETADCKAYNALIGLPERAPDALLADKGYDADAIRADLAAREIDAVIPGRSNRRVTIEHGRLLYKQRNRIEGMFGHLKINRAIATQYDQLANSFLGMVSAVPAGTKCSRLALGRRYSPAPEGLSCRRAVDLPGGRTWATTGSACARRQIPSSPCRARRCEMAAGQLAPRDQRPPDGSLCGMRVRVADGARQRIGAAGAHHMPGEEACWWVSIARTASENTISPTVTPTPRSRTSPAPSRRAGFANRRTSNSRRNSASTTSKDDHGPGCIATFSRQ